MIEPVRPSGGDPGPLSTHCPGFFWTRSSMIGMTPEELAAVNRGEPLSPERTDRLKRELLIARMTLINAPVHAARV